MSTTYRSHAHERYSCDIALQLPQFYQRTEHRDTCFMHLGGIELKVISLDTVVKNPIRHSV